jgi:prevent-host-death family protein
MISQQPTEIGAGAFKSQCLQLLDSVARTHAPLIITKRGKAVAKLVPIEASSELFGVMAGSVLHQGDILSPLDVQWNAATP